MEGLRVQILKYALPLMLSAGFLLVASPFAGNWRMNHDKSSYTRGDLPKEETMSFRTKAI